MFKTIPFYILLIFLNSMQIFSVPSDIDVDSVKILFFHGPTYKNYAEYNLDDAKSILQHPKFIHKHTTLFLHGFNNTRQNNSTKLLASSYLKRNSSNFLNIDWEKLSRVEYITAQQNVLKISPRIADFIINLFQYGLEENNLNLLGNSLGSLGVGVIARNVVERSNGFRMISRMTLFDPSNEETHGEFIMPPIDKTVAKFVDVIHTDAGGIGTTNSVGHVDFWPNNGTALQPGCPDKKLRRLCSHRKATAYWAESVRYGSSKSMLAFASGNYDTLLNDGLDNYNNSAVLMGIDCNWSARGDYYLQYNTTYGDFYPVFTE
ncbi:pancreatic triacylglycerol lipase-like [Eupeodes corollae]|uniref:pancreatic triacylglycerol lipase-like n=1 Tax=Eupeodes corollae TaxID=290404 RepID=UPI0024923A41|nr:pancreatic triacylglycerol lipase-like [Eupeodes corollae]